MIATDAVAVRAETMVSDLGATRFFRGRLGVLGFHARNVMCWGVVFACAIAVGEIGLASKTSGGSELSALALVTGWTLIGTAVVAIVITFVNMTRRLNDLDFRRWWILLTFVPLVNIFLHLWLYFWPGNDSVNRFGNPPLPGQFERNIGRIALGITVIVIIGGMWSLRKQTPMDVHSEKPNSYDATLARFTANEPRALSIRSEAMFRESVVDHVAYFVGEHVDAPMVFKADGTLLGSFTQHGGVQEDSDLLWSWHEGKLCREGRIARVRIPRLCGSASLVPDAGLVVNYEGAVSTERWVLEARALERAALSSP